MFNFELKLNFNLFLVKGFLKKKMKEWRSMDLSLGEKIMILRLRKGITKNDLGGLLFKGLSAPHIKMRKIETGVQAPTQSELDAIAKALSTTVDNLTNSNTHGGMVSLPQRIFDENPRLVDFVKMLNSAAKISKEMSGSGMFRATWQKTLEYLCRSDEKKHIKKV